MWRSAWALLAMYLPLSAALPQQPTLDVRDDASLRSALQAAGPGARIRIAPGRYRPGVYVANLRGTEGNPIVIEGADPASRPIFEAGTTGSDPEPEAEDEGGGGRVWNWVALGVGGAAGIAGAAIGGAAMSKKSTLEDSCDGNHCPPSQQGEADTIETMNLTADVLFGVAAAGIITGVILFFVEPDDESEAEVAVTPAFTGNGAGLAVGGRF